jgi:hypothetical protein
MGRKLSLDALAREQLEAAGRAPAGRSARTAVGGYDHVMRQTVIALHAGQELAEHENPGEATLQVLHGRVRLVAGDTEWEGRRGDPRPTDVVRDEGRPRVRTRTRLAGEQLRFDHLGGLAATEDAPARPTTT